ncbi:hypothetical protein [Streptomyces microflavus]|uniref:hypothetical protein n=1 Tax=Streptomyces microflavus TaxID=1919 RepID=UPI0036474A33
MSGASSGTLHDYGLADRCIIVATQHPAPSTQHPAPGPVVPELSDAIEQDSPRPRFFDPSGAACSA